MLTSSLPFIMGTPDFNRPPPHHGPRPGPPKSNEREPGPPRPNERGQRPPAGFWSFLLPPPPPKEHNPNEDRKHKKRGEKNKSNGDSDSGTDSGSDSGSQSDEDIHYEYKSKMWEESYENRWKTIQSEVPETSFVPLISSSEIITDPLF